MVAKQQVLQYEETYSCNWSTNEFRVC